MTVGQLLTTLSDVDIVVTVQDYETEEELLHGQVYEIAADELMDRTVKAWVPMFGGDYIELLISNLRRCG